MMYVYIMEGTMDRRWGASRELILIIGDNMTVVGYGPGKREREKMEERGGWKGWLWRRDAEVVNIQHVMGFIFPPSHPGSKKHPGGRNDPRQNDGSYKNASLDNVAYREDDVNKAIVDKRQ